MKKRLLSIMLCLTLIATMLAGISIQTLAADDGLTLVDQDFKNLTAMPSDWTLSHGTAGTHFEYHANGIRAKELSPGVGFYKNSTFNTDGAGYTISAKFSFYSGAVWVHFGATTTDDATKNGISSTGYTLHARTSDYKAGIYNLYKNGTLLGQITEPDPSSWLTNKGRRTVTITVTPTEVVAKLGTATTTFSDTNPITQGYVGVRATHNAVHSNVVNFELLKLVKSFAVNEAANVIPATVLVDGTTPVKVAFNAPIEPTTVTKTNAYLTDAAGNKINDNMYEVALEGTNTIMFTPSATNQLKYKTTYKAVVGTGIQTVAGNALGASKAYPFTTENPPFEVLATLNNGTDDVAESASGGEATDVTAIAGQSLTMKFTVSNTERYNYGDKSAYAIVSFEDASGKALATVAKKVEVPSRGAESSYIALTTDESVTVPADATVMRSYILTSALDNYYPTPDAGAVVTDANVTYEGDTVTVSGTAGTQAGKDVYLMMMNMDNSGAALVPYDFDTNVAIGTEFGSEIQKLAKTSTGENGAFTFTIPMNVTGTTAANWRFYIGGDEYSTAQMQEFYFANVAMKNSVAEGINDATDAAAVLTILEDDTKTKALGIDDNAFIAAFEAADAAAADPTAKALMNELASKLYDAKVAANFSETDGGADFIAKLNELSVYVAIKNDMRELIVGADGQFTTEADDVLKFGDLDTANGTTVTAVFEGELLAATQTAVLDAIMGKDYSAVADIYTDFKNNVMVNGFKNVADIAGFLRDNAGHFGIDLTTYNKLSTDQMTQTNEALRLATTLDATSTATVASSIQAIIDTLIQGFDLSVYSYTFTSADTLVSGNTTPSGWVVTQGVGKEGTFTDSGYKVETGATGENKHYNEHSLMSPTDKTISGDYIMSVNMSKSYNDGFYYFNYVNGSNHCYVKFSYGSAGITLGKVVGGTTTVVEDNTAYAGNNSVVNNAQVIVEKDGFVTVTNAAGTTTYIKRTNMGMELTGGRFGARLESTPGTIKTITLKSYLSVNNVTESGETDMVDTEIAPVITGTFNYPVDASTVNTDTVKILDADGNVIENAVESASATNGGSDFTVTVKAGALDYKTDYYLNLTTGIKLALRDASFISEVKLPFNTKAPELNITSMGDTAEGSEMLFTNDISRYKEVYTNVSSNGLVAANGQTANVYMKGENTGAAKTVDIYVTIEDGNTTYKVTKVSGVTLAAGGSGWITPTGFSATDATLTTIAVPTNVTETAKVRYYVIEDNAKLTSAYPFVANSAVTDNGNRPTFSLVGEDLSVWGNTYSGTAGKVVNLVVENATNVPKIVATTKTGANGRYVFDITLNPTEFTDGSYHIYVGGEEFGAKVTPMDGSSEKTLEYMTPASRDSVVTTINTYKVPNVPTANVAAIRTTIINNADELGFDSANQEGVNVYQALMDADTAAGNTANMDAVAAKVGNRTGNFATDDGADDFVSFVREAMVIQAYTAGLSTALYGTDGEFLLDDIVDLSNVDGMSTTNGTNTAVVDAYTVYTDTLNDTGRTAVRNALLRQLYVDSTVPVGTGIDELQTKFIEQVVLASLNDGNVEADGAGHITEIITNNGIAAGIAADKYNTYVALGDGVNAINTTLLQSSVPTISALSSMLVADSGTQQGSAPSAPPTGGIPSGSPSGTGTSVSIVGGATIAEAESKLNFTDLAGYEWATEAIQTLAKEGVVSGDGNGSFRPGDRVKREELMKMALYGMDININNYVGCSFTDADKSHWAYKVIATAEEKGFTTGRGDGTFGFGEDITRQEVATILYRILVSLGKAGNADTSVLNGFNDKNSVADYAVDAISFMVDNGIINGVEANVLAPNDYCTRAQVAKMVYGVMNYLK